MADSDLSVAILREIREDVRTTRSELKAEIAATRTELKAEIAATRTELKAEISVTNVRLEVIEHTLKDLGGQQLILTRYVRNAIDKHDDAIEDLDERVINLERTDKPSGQ